MTLEQMKNVDVRTVDINTLVDANEVNVNMELPKLERMTETARQMNPYLYCFKTGRIVTKVSHAKTTRSINDCLESLMRMH